MKLDETAKNYFFLLTVLMALVVLLAGFLALGGGFTPYKSSISQPSVEKDKKQYFDSLGLNPTNEQLCSYALQRFQSALGELSSDWGVRYQLCSKGPTNSQVTLQFTTYKFINKGFLESLDKVFQEKGYSTLRKWVQDGAFLLDEADGKGFLMVSGKFEEKKFSVIGEREFKWVE